MRIAKILAGIGLSAMTIVLVNGFIIGDFASDGRLLLSNPWGIVSMVDLYVGFILFSGWIVFREEKILTALLWVIFMMVLGFFTGSMYVLVSLYKSHGNWEKFWLGKHAK
jgi:hypothetical protein